MNKKIKSIAAVLVCFVLFFATGITALGHGLYVLTGPEGGGIWPADSTIHAQVGEPVIVTGGWGYNFLGPDGGVQTGHLHRFIVISPDGARTELTHEWYHQADGRDDRTRRINRVDFHRIGVDPFPTGGRHNIFVQSSFIPQSEGYYQVVFERFTVNANFDNADHANYGLQTVQTSHVTVMVGDPEPVAETGFAGSIGTGRLEIIPTSDVGRLTHEEGVLEGILLLNGQPLPNKQIRINIPGSGILDGAGGHNDWLTPDEFSTDATGRFSVPLPALGITSPGFYSIQVPLMQISDVAGTVPGADVNFTRMSEIYLFHFFVPPGEERVMPVAAGMVSDAQPGGQPGAQIGAQIGNQNNAQEPDTNEPIAEEPITTEPATLNPTSPASEDLPSLFNIANIISLIVGGALLFGAGLLVGLASKRK